jgi:hypothetical protein
MKEVKSFVIDRSIWLRGESGKSYLLRSRDGKQCCLGIFAHQCGVPKSALRNNGIPDTISVEWQSHLPHWMFVGIEMIDDGVVLLMRDNDMPGLSEEERERRIKEGFAKFGVEVSFTG